MSVSVQMLQQRAAQHLLSGSDERLAAWRDLVEEGFFSATKFPDAPEWIKGVRNYLRRNPRGFCREGIDRFCVALGIEARNSRRVTLTFEVEVVPREDRYINCSWEPQQDSGAARTLENALVNTEHPVRKIVKARLVKARLVSSKDHGA
jgi:hypothetical protein